MSDSAPRLPALDPAALQEALGLIPAPVAVVGVRAGERRGGLTAAWLTRVSIAPPLLLVSVGLTRHTHELLAAAPTFSVSLLREDQVPVARLFGRVSQRERDKWAEVDVHAFPDGTPALARCAARFLCVRRDAFPAGDHTCFVGEIVAAAVVAGGPALPMRREDYPD